MINKATVSDAKAVVDFLNAVGGETDFLTFGENDFPISVEEEQKIIADCLERDTNLMLVAKINQVIVSQLFLDVSTQPRLSHIGHLGLSVSKAHWGKSIGSQMLEQSIDWAKKKRLSKLQLQVRTDNHQAIKLYEKFGFVCEGKITQALKIQQHFYDEFVMGLTL